MKKFFLIICCIIILIILATIIISCKNNDLTYFLPGNYNIDEEFKPSNQIGTTWKCDDPDICLNVKESSDGYSNITGSVNYNGKNIDIYVIFNPGRSIFIYNTASEEGRILSGICEFGQNQFVVEIDKESDHIFNKEFDYLTFYKLLE